MIDYTLTIGTVLQTLAQMVVFTVWAIWFIIEMRNRLNNLYTQHVNFSQRLDVISREIKELASLTIQLARQDERMNAQDIRLNELSRRFDEYQSQKNS